MRIIDGKTKNELRSVLIMLTPGEANELAHKLVTLDSTQGEHWHINDENYSREITIAIYTPDNLHFYKKEIQDLLNTP